MSEVPAEPSGSSAPTPFRRAERRAVGDVLTAAILFGGCNIAWRYGAGPAIGIVGYRTFIGMFVAVAIARRRGVGVWTDALRSREGRIAVGVSTVGIVAAGTMFRTLDGQLAALALACTPAVALLVRERSGRISVVAALGSSAAAIGGLVWSGIEGGGASITWFGAAAVVAFVAIEVLSLRTGELAVEHGVHPATLVSATMIVGSIVLLPAGLLLGAMRSPSTLVVAIGAAFVVAVFGTVGRVLRSAAVPVAGVMSTAASAQLTALVTAVGGVLLLGDHVVASSVVLSVVAAVLGATAVVSGARWRLAHEAELDEPIEIGLDLGTRRPAAE